MKIKYSILILIILFIGIWGYSQRLGYNNHSIKVPIVLVPFKGVSQNTLYMLKDSLENRGFIVSIVEHHSLPKEAYYIPRNRYKADKILKYLKIYNSNKVLGITNKDISTTLNGQTDWGIMGLANCPGNQAIISTFRLRNVNKDLPILAIHELGHTYGLPHCNNICLMRAAKGKPDYTVRTFCNKCKFLLNKYSFSQ